MRLGLGLGYKQRAGETTPFPLTGPLTVAVFGDSISFANTITSGGTQRTHESVGYMTNYNMIANQRLYFPYANNLGVSGDDAAEMEARKEALADINCDVVIVLGGTNSITGKVSAAATIADLDIIVDYVCGTLGKYCVWLPILPRDYWVGFSAGEITQGLADIATINAHIYSRHGDHGGLLISDTADFHDDMDDGAGGAITESTYDDLHPAPYGGMLNGIALDRILAPYFGRNAAPDFSAADNLLVNGVMAGTGGTASSGTSGSVATSFSSTHSGGTGATAMSKDVDGKQLLAHSTFNGTTTDNSRLSQTITQASGKFDVGDVLYGHALVEVLASPTPARITQVALQLRLTGTGAPTLVNGFGNDRRQSPNWVGESYGLTPGIYLIETPDLPVSQGSSLSAEWRFEVQGDSATNNTATATVKIHGAGVYKRTYESLAAVEASTVFDLDARILASNDGVNQNWNNLCLAPADGTAQSANHFTLGNTTSVAGDDPTRGGTAGTPGAHFIWSSASASDFMQFAGATTPFFRDMHKTTGGSDFWFSFDFTFVQNDQTQCLFATSNSATVPGLRVVTTATEKLQLTQRDNAGVNSNYTGTKTLVNGTRYIAVISHSHSTDTTSIWIDDDMVDSGSHTFNTDTTDANDVPAIGAEADGGVTMQDNTIFWHVGAGNAFLDDEGAAAVIAELQARRT